MTKAWVTLLTQPSYLPGVIALQLSLRRAKSRFPLVVMVTEKIDEANRKALLQEECLLRDVAPLAPEAGVSINYAAPQFSEVWTKLRVWQLSEFDRVAFVDADMLILHNMDELLSMPLNRGGLAACHACRCNPHHRSTYPASWVPENCFYTHVSASGPYPVVTEQDYFNAGLLVLEPDPATFSKIESELHALPEVAALPFAEQDLLNMYFAGNWQPLPYIYNALKPLSQCHADIWDLQAVKNLHYILDKPWVSVSSAHDDPYARLNQFWWAIYTKQLAQQTSN